MKKIKSFLLMTAGCILLAVGVYFFKIPNGFATGGVTGIATVLAKIVPITPGVLIWGFNIALMIIGFIFLGGQNGLKTFYCSMLYSAITYVLEYLLGMYCATDDEDAIQVGLDKIKKILSENYVRPDQSEYVKSKIKENGQYTIIDKITVIFDDREDKYVARFTNLRMDPFEVSSDLVVHNEKLLVGGIWCIVKIDYVGLDKFNDIKEGDIFEAFIMEEVKK